jgi:hypothetical protein
MMMVIPAAKIMSLLVDHPDLIDKRRKSEAESVAMLGLDVKRGGANSTVLSRPRILESSSASRP